MIQPKDCTDANYRDCSSFIGMPYHGRCELNDATGEKCIRRKTSLSAKGYAKVEQSIVTGQISSDGLPEEGTDSI